MIPVDKDKLWTFISSIFKHKSISFASAALLYFVIRRFSAGSSKRKNLLVTDLSRVGRAPGCAESPDHEFDVVIVGGGTAGCVLASRLTEDPSIRVLLLEAGGSGLSVPASRIPAAWPFLMRTEHSWNYFTEPQTALIGKTVKYWPQGKMLGGSSSSNAMIYHRACPEDFDAWANNNSDPDAEMWTSRELHTYFRKSENYNPSGEFDGDYNAHGYKGPVKVGHSSYYTKLGRSFITACENVGILKSNDLNSHRGSTGCAKSVTCIDSKGQRVSAETAYLTPDVLSRPNLKVAIHAHVTRVLFDKLGDTIRAVGVEFANTGLGPRFYASAKKEVIVSAGGIHTPQVLMLSGVGPAEQLAAHSIPLVQDLPGVGSNLMDHASVPIRFRDKTRTSLGFNTVTVLGRLRLTWLGLLWNFFGKGPLTTNVAEVAAFERSWDPKLFPADETVSVPELPSSGPRGQDLELVFSPAAHAEQGMSPVPLGYLCSLYITLLKPTSRGTITLKSGDPFDQVAVDPKYLSTKNDLLVFLRGLKLAIRIARTAPLSDALDEKETDSFLDQDLYKLDDEQLADVVKSRIETLYHPTSTARMAPLSDGGVVDPYLRVHGIPNLRVVDASIFPDIPAGHTAGVVYGVAEKAADLIKAALGVKME